MPSRELPPNAQAPPAVFELEDLAVEFAGSGQPVRPVRGISLAVAQGETLGIVGESGSGKSVSLLASLGLLPTSRIASGRALFDGRDLATLLPAERRSLLGREIGLVFQNPVASLNPVLSVGAQLREAIRVHHHDVSRRAADAQAVELLDMVGITDAASRARQYPHQFSGGMCQRAMIAIALANQPRLLIADEPTTAVDVTIQAQLLALLASVGARESGSSILVSHDLGVIAENTTRVAVMYGGRVMEQGPTSRVLEAPQHPYTQGLLSCRPHLHHRALLIPIPGQPPDPADLGAGCPFQPRCPVGRDDPRCAEVTPEPVLHEGRHVACHHAGAVAFQQPVEPREDVAAPSSPTTLLSSQRVSVTYAAPRSRLFGRPARFAAVDGVDLEIRLGEAIGLVGESGSGKSTMARVMMRLLDADAGSVRFAGTDVTRARRRELAPMRERVQIVFQDPQNSMNPRLTAAQNAAEPLRLKAVPTHERRHRVLERFHEVGLGEEHLDRLPSELSGGQLQRVGIARALVLDPQVLVLDEPVSSLDVSVQAQILNLLHDLKRERGLAYLFISHDMSVVRYLCDRIAVMYMGRIVEQAPTETLFGDPVHPYTRGLLDAVPGSDARDRQVLAGEQRVTDSLTGGCRFRPRCPLAEDRCASVDPQLQLVPGDRQVACIVQQDRLTRQKEHTT